jgi:hypothetical protein
VISAAAYFYTYASSQVLVPLIIILLFIVDTKYHWKQRRYLWPAILLGLVLAIPAIRFNLGPVDGFHGQMGALDSYLLKSLPLGEKISIFFKEYLSAFNPTFWLSPDINELIRHRLKGHGYFPQIFAPFLLLGFLLNLIRITNPVFRCLFICAIAIPVPGALCNQTISRLLTMTIPFTLWTVIGLDWLVVRLKTWPPILALLMAGLSFTTITMAVDALKNGPLWYREYSLYGLQFGTRHLFETEIPLVLKKYPHSMLRVTPNFANDPDSLIIFFLTPQECRHVKINSLDLMRYSEIQPNDIFVLTRDEYNALIQTGKFEQPTVLHTLAYPDASIGFYFLKLQYVENIKEIFEAERQRRLELVRTTAVVDGINVKIGYSTLDMGSIGNIFDEDPSSLARGLEANPFILEMEFDTAKAITRLGVNFGTMRSNLLITLTAPDLSESKVDKNIDGREASGLQWISFDSKKVVKKIKILIRNPDGTEVDHIHIFGMKFDYAA